MSSCAMAYLNALTYMQGLLYDQHKQRQVTEILQVSVASLAGIAVEQRQRADCAAKQVMMASQDLDVTADHVAWLTLSL